MEQKLELFWSFWSFRSFRSLAWSMKLSHLGNPSHWAIWLRSRSFESYESFDTRSRIVIDNLSILLHSYFSHLGHSSNLGCLDHLGHLSHLGNLSHLIEDQGMSIWIHIYFSYLGHSSNLGCLNRLGHLSNLGNLSHFGHLGHFSFCEYIWVIESSR